MKAAVLRSLGQIPQYSDFAEPVSLEGELQTVVLAAALKNIDRMQAAGTHYDRIASLPAVCGVDGVVRLADGTRAYTGQCRAPFGMMAEKASVRLDRLLPIPDGVDDCVAAALPNAVIASWLPLIYRAGMRPGETVWVLGATGATGRLAIKIANLLGAGQVVALGRNRSTLDLLESDGAHATIELDGDVARMDSAIKREAAKQRPDIVLDYLWGIPAEGLLNVLAGQDLAREVHRTRYVQIGEMAGGSLTLPGSVLRSSGLELYGSGGGSLAGMQRMILETLPKAFEWAASGKLMMEVDAVPLKEVSRAWNSVENSGRRIVFVP